MNKDKKLFILQVSVINVTVLATDSFQGFWVYFNTFQPRKENYDRFSKYDY